MIDYIVLEGITRSPEHVQGFLPKLTGIKDTNSDLIHESIKRNSTTKFSLKGNVLTISGSLHKAINLRTQGTYENVAPITCAQVQEQLDWWVNEFSLVEESVIVKKIEFASNCSSVMFSPHQPLGLIEGFRGGNGRLYFMDLRYYKNKPFQRSHDGNDLRFTSYDKGNDWNLDKLSRKAAGGILRFEISGSFHPDPPRNLFPRSLACLQNREVQRQALLLLRSYIEKLQFRSGYVEGLPKFTFSSTEEKQPTDLKGSKLVSYILLHALVRGGGDLNELRDEFNRQIKLLPVTPNVRKAAKATFEEIAPTLRQSSDIPLHMKEIILIQFDKEMAYYLGEQVNHPGYVGEMLQKYYRELEKDSELSYESSSLSS